MILIFFSASELFQPLMQRKQEHEKKRREVKEQWQRAKRKLVRSQNGIYSLPLGIISSRRVHSDTKTCGLDSTVKRALHLRGVTSAVCYVYQECMTPSVLVSTRTGRCREQPA